MSSSSSLIASKTPSSWTVITNDGITLTAVNKETGETFTGTPHSFSNMFVSPADVWSTGDNGGDGGGGDASAANQLIANTLLDTIGDKLPDKVSESLPVLTKNVSTKFREAFEQYIPASGKWVEVKGSGDLIFVDGNTAAASYLVISKDPLTQSTESAIETPTNLPFRLPVELSVGLSMSQRTLGQEFSVEIVDTQPELAPIADLPILAISQTTTVLTIDFASPHSLVPGKAIGVHSCSEGRFNYPGLVVATIPSPTQITCTAGPNGTLPSLTIANPAGAKGSVFFRERLGRSQNGVSQIFENASLTNSSMYIRSEAGDALLSGTFAGNHSVTTGTTAPVQLVNTAYSYSFVPTTEFKISIQSDRTQWSDAPVDTATQATNRLIRTQVCPNPGVSYKFRVRAVNTKSLTVPTAQIVSVSKTGTTTATIVFDRPHNLTLADQIVAYGVRDQTNFANLVAATAIASIVDATSIRVVWGTAVTATSTGGYVARVNGSVLMSSLGASAVVLSTVSLTTLADGTRQLNAVGNTNWAGLTIGDLVNLVGVRDAASNNSLGVDGAWKVANASTTNLTLVLPFAGSLSLPADFGVTNAGGAVIKRTDLRISFVRIFDYERLRVEALSRPASDAAAGMPVTVQNTVPVSGSVTATVASTTIAGTTAADAAVPNPVAIGGRASNANIAAMSATGDLVNWLMTMIGAGIVKPYALPEAGWNASLSLTSTTAAAIQAAAGTGLKRHITALQAINTGAAAVDLIILDGTTERWRLTLPIDVPVAIEFPTELVNTANTALNANLSAAGTVRANFQGYTAP